jgi:hypothetical protein
VAKLCIFDGIDDAAEVTRSDATVFIKSLPEAVGLGMQKYPSLQFAQAQP